MSDISHKWEFDKRMSIGNAITILVIVTSFIAGYAQLKQQAAKNSELIRITQSEVTSFRSGYVSKEMYQIQDDRLTRIENKLDRLIQMQLSN